MPLKLVSTSELAAEIARATAADTEQIKSANFTAVVGESYVTTATLTVSDPTSPTNGQSYTVRVSAGTATVGGVAYATAKTLITRSYNGGAWSNSVESPNGVGSAQLPMASLVQQLVFVGDSLTSGMTSPNTISYPTALMLRPPALGSGTANNLGSPGSGLTYLEDNYTADVFPLRPAATGSPRSVLFVWTGANDYQDTATNTPSSYIARLQSYWQDAKDDGFTVVAFTIIGRTGDNNTVYAKEVNRRAINELIRESSEYYDMLVDVAALFPDPTDTDFFIDGTHLNDEGNKRLAAHVAAIVMSQGYAYKSTQAEASLTPSLVDSIGGVLDRAAISFGSAYTGFGSLSPAVPARGTGNFTFEAWMKWPDSAPYSNFYALGRSGGSGFGVGNQGNTASGAQIFLENGASPSSLPGMRPTYWNHIAAVRSGTAVTFYVNGVASGTTTDSSTWTILDRVNIASSEGGIARVRAFNYAKTAAQVLSSFRRLSVYDPTDTGCIYAMSDASTAVDGNLQDMSATGAVLTLSGSANYNEPVPPASTKTAGLAKMGTGAYGVAEFSDTTNFGSTTNFAMIAFTGGDRYFNAPSGSDLFLCNAGGIVGRVNGLRFQMEKPFRLKGYTVATLPSGAEGDTAYVTDATTPTYLGALTGGGAVKCPVFYNGSAWVSA